MFSPSDIYCDIVKDSALVDTRSICNISLLIVKKIQTHKHQLLHAQIYI